MTRTVIQVEGLGKRYRIGQPRQQNALRHVIGDALRAPVRLLSGNSNVPRASSPIIAFVLALGGAVILERPLCYYRQD
jgi:hypothetical protein